MTALKFITAGLIVLAALPLVGQDKPIPPANVPPAVPEEQLRAERRAAAGAKAAEMTEDVEVLRLLLNKSLGLSPLAEAHSKLIHLLPRLPDSSAGGSTVGPPLSLPFDAAYPVGNAAPVLLESFDGVYLKGHGIAYTLRRSAASSGLPLPAFEKVAGLAATCQNCHTADAVEKFHLTTAANTAKPPTDWEKARDELRGVPPKAGGDGGKPSLAVVCGPGILTETVTKVLAANGRHLRHLTADEGVSVVVTYEGVTGPAHDRATGTMADPNLWTPPAATGTKFGFTPDEARQLVLGDLHLKQGKHADAVKAYETAVARYPATLTTITPPKEMKAADLTAAVKELQGSVATAYKSLAQAYIGVGNLDEAKRALELAQKVEIKVAAGDKKPAGPPVPAKIILTVKKAHLDAAEKLSPANFRKGVTVETVGMAGVKK